jgi:hypothetical protein
VAFYNQRGTAEQHIKEGKQAINWTRLSCKGMAQNEVRPRLHALAYNLGVFLQATDLPEDVADWSLTSLQNRVIKIGARGSSATPAPSPSNSLRLLSMALCSAASWRPSKGCAHRGCLDDGVSDKT